MMCARQVKLEAVLRLILRQAHAAEHARRLQLRHDCHRARQALAISMTLPATEQPAWLCGLPHREVAGTPVFIPMSIPKLIRHSGIFIFIAKLCCGTGSSWGVTCV